MIKNTLNILLFIFVLNASSGAAELQEYRGPEIIVRYEAPLKNAARQIASDYKTNRVDIEMKLGWRLRSNPVVVLMRNNAFQEMAGNKLVTAFAVPEKNLIVIDYSKMDRSPFDLRDTFKHELTHLLLHQKIKSPALPKWLDEGVAQWASGGMADILNTERDLLQPAVLSHSLIPLSGLSSTFPDSPSGLTLAYEESKSFVEFIVNQYGDIKLRALLHRLEKQGTIEQAVYDNYGVSLDMLEQSWKKSLLKNNLWISYLADHLYWLLFFLAALITISGYCVVKRRIRNYRDEEDEAAEGESAEQSGDE
jgi:hypothetical protein